MSYQIEVYNPGLISIEELLFVVFSQYNVNLNDLGVPLPRNLGVVQQYKWHFLVNRKLDTVVSYFSDEKAVEILLKIGKHTRRQFELRNGHGLDVGAQGYYWIKNIFTLAKGKLIISNKGLKNGVFRLGYVRLEDLRKNWALLGMADKSEFGFSMFEFSQAADKKTNGSYYLAQQLPGHRWGAPLNALFRKKLNNPSFIQAFKTLKQNIEYFE